MFEGVGGYNVEGGVERDIKGDRRSVIEEYEGTRAGGKHHVRSNQRECHSPKHNDDVYLRFIRFE